MIKDIFIKLCNKITMYWIIDSTTTLISEFGVYDFIKNILNLLVRKPYLIVGDAIIFESKFNNSLDNYTKTISNCRILIFSNYSDPYLALKYNNDHLKVLENNVLNHDDYYLLKRSKFNHPLHNSLSDLINLRELTFGHSFNHPLGDSLSTLTNLQKLTFDYYFNQPLGNSLSNLHNLIKLTFGFHFDHPLGDSLSNLHNLIELSLGSHFNHPLDNSLSNLINLRKLNLGYGFNHPLDNSLSNLINLEELTFGNSFDHPLNNSLSYLHNLKELTFGNYFNKPLDDSLSNLINLRKLILGNVFNQSLNLILSNLVNLEELFLGIHFNQPIDIPHGIKKLSLHCNSQSIIDYLPSSIVELEFGWDFNLELDDLPGSIKKIKILNAFYDKKLNNLPNRIECLEISSNYKIPIDREYKNLNIVYFN